MSVETQVETARRAVVGTGQQAAHLATGAWGQAHDLVGQGVELVEGDVVVPLSRRAKRLKNKVAPPPKRRRSPLGLALLALVLVVVGAAIVRRRRFARLEVDRAGARVGDPPPDAFGAAVTAVANS